MLKDLTLLFLKSNADWLVNEQLHTSLLLVKNRGLIICHIYTQLEKTRHGPIIPLTRKVWDRCRGWDIYLRKPTPDLSILYDVPFKTKCIIMKYRTGTLYNQKHAVLFKLSTSQTCPLCPQVDSALHILSGCQHTQIKKHDHRKTQLSMPHDL